jgi:hypothetical protein
MRFHSSVYVAEEMEARGWDRDRLALEMVGGDRERYGVTRLALDFFFEIGPTDPHCQTGPEMCAQLATAFGVSTELFVNLEKAWLSSHGVQWVGSPSPTERNR